MSPFLTSGLIFSPLSLVSPGPTATTSPSWGFSFAVSGIYIPDTAKEKPQEGEVVAVGPGETNDNGEKIKPDVKKGDKVVYSKYGGTEIKVDGEEYLILSSRDILAVVGK